MAKRMNGQKIVNLPSEQLAQTVRQVAPRGPAPVHLWDPPLCGALDMRIARDGSWHYQGSPITRPALVRLFASILRRDAQSYVLVTPVEKFIISVEDAPFVAVDFQISGKDKAQKITFTTQLDETVTAGPQTPIRIDAQTGTPYVTLRANLEARIDRKSFYRLAEIATPHQIAGENWLGLWSDGQFFKLGQMDI